MDLGLKDCVALVAASSQGLGKAVAWGLAREGARVALCARTESVLLATAEEIRREIGIIEVIARNVDVTVRDHVRRFVADSASHFGRLDICIANAGGPPSKSFPDTTIEDWHRAAEVNLMSTVLPGPGDVTAYAAAPLGTFHRYHIGQRQAATGRSHPFELDPVWSERAIENPCSRIRTFQCARE